MTISIGGNKLAKRPVFVIKNNSPFYEEKLVEFKFYSGFAEVQKRRSINSLHESFLLENPGYKILEISSKSEEELGIRLSAFNLMMETNKSKKKYSVEVAFQSSKVFEKGGPYLDILEMSSRDAKKDRRLKESGRLKYFYYFGKKFNLNPVNYFYNWLYINTLNLNKELADEVMQYDGFTDIEFNPDKSLNCQARAAAVYVSLRKQGLLEKALESKEKFLEVAYGSKNDNGYSSNPVEQLSILDKL